jgi:caffeoyl-CoA O-methyltransferase
MKHGSGSILHPEQESYLDRLLPPRDPLLREMEEHARKEGVPISDPEIGRLLAILARSLNARHILEIGTALGYGTLCLARGAAEARVVTIELEPRRIEQARGYLERGGVADRVEIVEGAALDVLPRLDGPPFDLVFVDAVKKEYRRYLDLLLPRLRVGGLIVIDNLLWKGHVAEPPEDEDDEVADSLRAFNGYLMMHPQLQAVVLPVGDGLGMATKTKPLISEMGGPY